jgi:hypothetical protein
MGAQNIVKEMKQYQEKWLQHIQRIDTNRIPKQALQYKPKEGRNIAQLRKRWRNQFHFEDQGTGNTPNPSGTLLLSSSSSSSFFNTFMQGIYNYIPDTNHVCRVHSVTAVLYLQFVLRVKLFHP